LIKQTEKKNTSYLLRYVPDIIFLPSADRRRFLKRSLESFDYVRMREFSGDCEDLALEIVLLATELMAFRTEPRDTLSPAIRGMTALLSRYVLAMLLGGVSGAEINGSYERLKDSMGAHM
jgi:hypothetical protein